MKVKPYKETVDASFEMIQEIEIDSIDLTDDIDVQEPRTQITNLIDNSNIGEEPTPHKTKDYTTILQPNMTILNKNQNLALSEISTVNFIKDLQKENPQIETVFIESDEDDIQTKTPIFVNNMVTFKPSHSTTIGNKKICSVNSAPTSKSNTKTKLSKSMKETFNEMNQVSPLLSSLIRETGNATLGQMSSLVRKNNSPVIARQISPSNLNRELIKNSSTIALQDTTDKSSRKYLIIPKKVESLLANSQNPISLTIPGIGPLLIPKPSDIFKSESTVTQLKYLNVKNTTSSFHYDPLTDSKYCWRYQRKGKRDLDGFKITDRLGFYKVEQQKTKTCAAKYKQIIKTLQLSINIKQKALLSIKNHRGHIENIRISKIDSNKTSKDKNSLQNRSRLSPSLTRHEATVSYSPNKNGNIFPIQLSSSESDSDLLVTKKIVFIKKNQQCRKRRKGRYLGKPYKKQQRKYQNAHIASIDNNLKARNKISKILENKVIIKGQPRKKEPQTSPIDNNLKANILENKVIRRGEPRKKEIMVHQDCKHQNLPVSYLKRGNIKEKSSEPSRIHDCHVVIFHDHLVQNALQKYNDYISRCTKNLVNTCPIIDNLKQFQEEIESVKPILVIAKHHCTKMDFQELFDEYNIVFPMSEITDFLHIHTKNMNFVDSAKSGYIKFVKPHILGKYLAGFRVRETLEITDN